MNNDIKFKAALGEFILAFTELEFALVELASWTAPNVHERKSFFKDYLKDSFESNRNSVSQYIKDSIPEIRPIWLDINSRIGRINLDRRNLVHGLINYSILQDDNQAILHHKGEVKSTEYNSDKIKVLTKEIYEILTGENGVNGELHIDFIRRRLNIHNESVQKGKIIYKVQNEILTDFKE